MQTQAARGANLHSVLRWLVCPMCHAKLLAERAAVVCAGCGLLYPVEDGIAVLLADRTR